MSPQGYLQIDSTDISRDVCYLAKGGACVVAAGLDDGIGSPAANVQAISAVPGVVSEGRRFNLPTCGPQIV
jgi:hypothetical protein